jgi:hypothetical protein
MEKIFLFSIISWKGIYLFKIIWNTSKIQLINALPRISIFVQYTIHDQLKKVIIYIHHLKFKLKNIDEKTINFIEISSSLTRQTLLIENSNYWLKAYPCSMLNDKYSQKITLNLKYNPNTIWMVFNGLLKLLKITYF